MNMHCLVTHVTYDDLFFLIIQSTDLAPLAVRALPWELFDEVCVQYRVVALTVEHFTTAAALNNVLFFCGKVHLLLTFLATHILS